MGLSVHELAWLFLIYSCLGWCAEVVFHLVNNGKFINRGFLNGPVCPIYGMGMLIIIACLTPLDYNIMILFAGSVLLTSALEFITGFILERFFHQKWWDYSKVPLNIKGYVCLKFSLLWGVACVFALKIVQPFILRVVEHMLSPGWLAVLAALYALLIADAAVTLAHVCGFAKRVKALAALEESAAEKRRELVERRNIIHLRLIKAFPDLRTGRFGEVIGKIHDFAEEKKNRRG